MNVVEVLPDTLARNHVAVQLVGSETSPEANDGEAQSAASRKDFIHKMKISLKELRETLVWLLIIQSKPLVALYDKLNSIIEETNELISIFVVSITSAKKNRVAE